MTFVAQVNNIDNVGVFRTRRMRRSLFRIVYARGTIPKEKESNSMILKYSTYCKLSSNV